MARVFGRNIGLWTAGMVGLVTIGPVAVFSPSAAALTLAVAGSLAAGTALGRISTLNARCETLSKEVDVLSQRLLKVEAAPAQRPLSAEAGQSDLRSEVHELTVEIGLLSGIVRDLSAVIRSQDDEIAALKARPVAPPALPAPIAPPPPSPAVVATPPIPVPPVETAWTPPAIARPVEPPAPAAIVPPASPVLRPIPPRPLDPAPGPDDRAILAAFDRDQIEVYLQPVVTLPQRKVVAYEAQARLRVDDQSLEAEQILPALERHGRTTELDRRMLARTGTIVRHLARRGSDARVTYGLSPLSLFELGFLKEIGRMASDEQGLAGLDVALSQASWRGLDSGQTSLLSALRGRVGFSLDRPTDLRFDARDLADHGIAQVKVPAELLLRPTVARGALTDIAVEDLAPALARARVRLVVTDVNAEADVPDLIDLNVPYAQGGVFAPARPVRGDILASLPPEPTPPPPQNDPGTERRSFRSLLRRAG